MSPIYTWSVSIWWVTLHVGHQSVVTLPLNLAPPHHWAYLGPVYPEPTKPQLPRGKSVNHLSQCRSKIFLVYINESCPSKNLSHKSPTHQLCEDWAFAILNGLYRSLCPAGCPPKYHLHLWLSTVKVSHWDRPNPLLLCKSISDRPPEQAVVRRTTER